MESLVSRYQWYSKLNYLKQYKLLQHTTIWNTVPSCKADSSSTSPEFSELCNLRYNYNAWQPINKPYPAATNPQTQHRYLMYSYEGRMCECRYILKPYKVDTHLISLASLSGKKKSLLTKEICSCPNQNTFRTLLILSMQETIVIFQTISYQFQVCFLKQTPKDELNGIIIECGQTGLKFKLLMAGSSWQC